MDKGLGNDSSSSSSAPITNSTQAEMFLRQLNRNSLKIAKPIRKPLPLPNLTIVPAPSSAIPHLIDPNPPQSQQPPVYNINKSDFRDVVQKLTGSPAHERGHTPPPTVAAASTRPPSSRLQRIRPPPLAQISNRPGQMAQILPRPQYDFGPRLGPLPPLPSVHTAAESPISAYMRYIQSSASPLAPNEFGQRPMPPTESPVSAYMRFFQNSGGSSSGPSQPPFLTSSAPFPVSMPLSPLPFGCVPSPRSPYGMKSSGFLFSPTGQLGLPPQLPLSPTGSPRWKGM